MDSTTVSADTVSETLRLTVIHVPPVILSDRYGPDMNDIWPDGGRVSWFANTGNLQSGRTWERRYIGRFPGMHRLKGIKIVAAHIATT